VLKAIAVLLPASLSLEVQSELLDRLIALAAATVAHQSSRPEHYTSGAGIEVFLQAEAALYYVLSLGPRGELAPARALAAGIRRGLDLLPDDPEPPAPR
jgi:hypothetical protein